MCCGGEGFGGDVQLDVVSVAVEMEMMTADDVTKGEHVEDKKKWTKHRTLGDAL